MARFFLFSLGFILFFAGAFILTMGIITNETAIEVWALGALVTLAGCLGVGKFLDCYV